MPRARSHATEDQNRAGRIRLLLLDVDGVMTGGEIIYNQRGRELKVFDVQDGTGIKLAQKAGLQVGILSGRRSRVVEMRARELGIDLVCQDSRDKLADGLAMARTLELKMEQVAFVGDEILDLPLLQKVGFAVTVANGRPELREMAHYVTLRRGGEGAVREIIEFILKSQKKWDKVIAPYLHPPA